MINQILLQFVLNVAPPPQSGQKQGGGGGGGAGGGGVGGAVGRAGGYNIFVPFTFFTIMFHKTWLLKFTIKCRANNYLIEGWCVSP